MAEIYCDTCGKLLTAPTMAELGYVINQHKLKCAPSPSKVEGEEEWQEKTPAFMSFDEVGTEVSGMLEALDVIELHNKEVSRARIRTPEGVKSFLLTTTLEPLIIDIDIDSTIKVRYEGETLSAAKRKVKMFRVWVKKPKGT